MNDGLCEAAMGGEGGSPQDGGGVYECTSVAALCNQVDFSRETDAMTSGVRPSTSHGKYTRTLVHKPGPLCEKCPLRGQPYVGARGE